VAAAILTEAAQELALAAATVRDRLRLDDAPYDVVLSGGTFDRVASLTAAVARQLERPNARVGRLEEEPAMGAVRLAIEALQGNE
jgi:N-acetylglucosamine kinase-like BadF-type ATPase